MAYDLNIRGADASHGKYGHAFLDRFLLTAQIKGVDGDMDVDMADGTTLGNLVMNQYPGIPKGNFKFSAVSSPAMEFNLQSLKNRQTPVLTGIAPRGLAAGALVRAFPGSFGKDGDKFDEKSVETNDFEIGARGDFHRGRILLSPKGVLLSGASGLGPVDDNTPYGGVSTFGGALYVWVWDIQGSGSPTFTVSVQHCATSGGTYTNLATSQPFSLTNGFPSSPQLIYVQSSVTVQPFTQISWSTTGSPTGVQAVGVFARSYDTSL